MSLPALNLLNFELPTANKCKYVLTSPRSLKACRKAGVKPIELLYKSLSYFERETETRDEAENLFQAYEKERQRKLALCRSIRNEFLLHGYYLMTDRQHKPERNKRYSPKLQDVKDRTLPVLRECYLKKRAETPENMRNLKEQSRENLERHLNLPIVNITLREQLGRRTFEQERRISTENKLNGERRNLVKISSLEIEEENKLTATELHNNIEKVIETDKKLHEEEVQKENFIKDGHTKINYSDMEWKINQQLSDRQVLNGIETERHKFPDNFEEFHCNVKLKEKRPSSECRRKTKETKRKPKATEQKRLLQNLKIQYSDPQYCIKKYKQVIENSVDREMKEVEVHRVQRELEEGMEKWQDRVLLLQWLDVNRARDQATRELEIKIERLQQKSRAKTIIHTININKVKEAEDMKAEDLRKQVEEKDRKIYNIHQDKERIIGESKSRALFIQDLKSHIRSIMTPETFDQKVAKLGTQKRVMDSHMCARIMQRSHIWLG